ncbi:MAG: ferrous iron transporter B [Chitinispirillaceae bacterium]|nr:ferrous iron transporter B [Chitinispirillaceae bacterium]
MKILLMGNPNVGKSAIFNRLTGTEVIISNYPGTTVEFSRGSIKRGDTRIEIIDVPGTYTLEPTCRAEEIAVRILENEPDSIIVNVLAAINLERSLFLTMQLVEKKRPMLVVLNMWDEAAHAGIHIDCEILQTMLGCPCVPTCAISGQGIKHMVEKLGEARIPVLSSAPERRWDDIGRIIVRVQTVRHRHHNVRERITDATVYPFPGLVVAGIILLASFAAIRWIGEGLINAVFEPLFEQCWKPVAIHLSAAMGGRGIVHDLIIGKLIDGQIDYGQSFGLLTTGLFVPFGAVLPYVFAFYTVLSILEDIGYLPRLAVISDVLMHRLGLHGLAVMPMLLGFGCNVPGILSTRILETRKERFIAATLTAIAVPCMSLQAMVAGLAGRHGVRGLLLVFCTLGVVWVVLGVILRRLVKGESPEIFVEIPPYRFPDLRSLFKKIAIRIKWFLKEAVPFVLLGVFIADLLYMLGVIELAGRILSPVTTRIMGLPAEAAGAIVVGFLRKDVAVGMLAPLNLTLKQLVIASVVLSMFFPCIATFVTMVRELGIKDMAKSAAIMILSSIVAAGILNLVLPAAF